MLADFENSAHGGKFGSKAQGLANAPRAYPAACYAFRVIDGDGQSHGAEVAKDRVVELINPVAFLALMTQPSWLWLSLRARHAGIVT